MNMQELRMENSDISVYGEAKGEYTRQLCVFLVPCLETYFLELLNDAKAQSSSPTKVLWNFQTLLQGIPDWNQDKVIRETDKIQKECKCDYLDELLTAVFIAHTKVLSAIRLTTKQKKLQITIPKVDHFIHRLLSESARTLWTNAFLFADANSIDRQKNLRQVSGLLHECVLQAIRGLLPVKSILREYLHDDDEDDADAETDVDADNSKDSELLEAKGGAELPREEEEAKAEAVKVLEVSNDASNNEVCKEAEADANESEEAEAVAPPKEAEEAVAPPKEAEEPVAPKEAVAPTIYIDTKPSVTFSNQNVMFYSENLENNEIHDFPDYDENEDENEDLDALVITDEVLTMDADEILS
jgi:hypothetical protein